MLDCFEVLRTTSFHDNFKNVFPFGHDGLKLIATIMFAMCFSLLVATRAMISPCSQLGWHGFFNICVGSSTSSFGCEKPAKRNIPCMCVKLEELGYVILK